MMVNDRRRKTPSYVVPFLYELLEMVMIWIVFSLFEGTVDISTWSLMSYGLAGSWFMYTFYKLMRVLNRQVHHNW